MRKFLIEFSSHLRNTAFLIRRKILLDLFSLTVNWGFFKQGGNSILKMSLRVIYRDIHLWLFFLEGVLRIGCGLEIWNGFLLGCLQFELNNWVPFIERFEVLGGLEIRMGCVCEDK